ncbi:hypothetical protein MD484_g957, partial [Candolleomyces efflorescens]
MNEETKVFLQKIKSDPDQVYDAIQLLFGTEIMRTAYGFEDIGQNEPLIHNAEKLVLKLAEGLLPGRFLVNYIPILRHVPSWFPGAGFKKELQAMAELNAQTRIPPFEEAKRDVEEGRKGSHPSMAFSLIDRLPEEGDPNRSDQETIARNVCAIAYMAGAETTASSATALVYILASSPEVQMKGQAEIDRVVGSDRLPLVSDRDDLPYIHAIVKEVGRWFTVAPLGVAHANMEDDEYDGYFIPKGTHVLQNNWAIMHDPDIFHRPFEFIPERYIKDGKIDLSVPDADIAAFGHGRRICPGRHFSNDALFLMAACFLATFNITAQKDEEGNALPMKLEQRNPSIRSEPYDPYVPRAGSSTGGGAPQSGGGNAKTAAIQAQIDDTVGIMRENITKVAERGERLDSLQDKTGASSLASFRLRNMWWKDMKMRIIIGVAIAVIIVIIVVSIVKATQK